MAIDIDAVLNRRVAQLAERENPTTATVASEDVAPTSDVLFDQNGIPIVQTVTQTDPKVGHTITQGKVQQVSLTEAPKTDALRAAAEEKIRALNEVLDASYRRQAAQDNTLAYSLNSLGTDSDGVRQVVSGGGRSVGYSLGALGRLTDVPFDLAKQGLTAAGFDVANERNLLGDFLKKLDAMSAEDAQAIEDSLSIQNQEAKTKSTPTGDLGDPETWSLGSDPSLLGYANHLAGITGQLLTQAPMAFTKAPQAASMAAGFLQAGGSQAGEVEERIANLSEEELLAESQYYRDLLESGVEPAEARARVAKAGSQAALGVGGIVGAAGGSLTAYVLKPLQKVLPDGFLARASLGGGLDTVAEGAQEVTESIASRAAANVATDSNRDLTEGGVGEFVLGALGGLQTGVAGALVSKGASNLEAKANAVRERAERGNLINTAARTGDVTALVSDPESKTYNPNGALAALRKYALDNEPDEKTVASVASTVAALKKNQATLVESLDVDTPEKLTKAQERVARLKAQGDEKSLAAAKIMEDGLRELETVNTQVQAAEKFQADLTSQMAVKNIDAKAAFTAADAAPSPESTAAAEQVVNLAMNAGEDLDIDTLDRLVANEDNALTPEQRTVVKATVASRRANAALKSLDDVKTDVFKGGDGYIGLEQHEARFKATTRGEGNRTLARKVIDGVTSFTASRKAKLDAITDAFEKVYGTQDRIFILRGDDGTWSEVAESEITPKDRAQGRALKIHTNSGNLLDQVAREYEALDLAQKSMEARFTYQFERGSASTGTATAAPSQPVSASPVSTQEVAGEVTTEVPAQAPTNTRSEEPSNDAASRDDDLPPVDVYGGEPATEQESVQEPAPEQTRSADTVTEPTNDADVASNTEPQSTQEPEPASENTEAVAEAQAQPEPNAGRLSVFEQAEAPKEDWVADDFWNLNHLTQFFKQSEGNEERGSIRPLAAVKDFLTQLMTVDGFSFDRFLLDPELTPKQDNAIEVFVSYAKDWVKTVTDLLPPKGSKRDSFRFEDPIHFFMDENGDIDENVKTAIVHGAYAWLAENAGNMWNDAAAINGLLGKPADEDVPVGIQVALAQAGQLANLVYAGIGQRVFQSLGLKALDHAPVEEQAKFESMFGAFAVQLLVAEGLLEINEIPSNTMMKFRGLPQDRDARETTKFVRFPLAKLAEGERFARTDPKVAAILKEIKDSLSDSHNVLAKLFGTEDLMRAPSLEPVKYSAPPGVNQPPELVEIVNRENAKPWVVRKDMAKLYEVFSIQNLFRIAGVRRDDAKAHVFNEPGYLAADEALMRQVNNYAHFVNGLPYDEETGEWAEFYFSHDIWSQQRVGIIENMVNPLNSKVHRYMLAMNGWIKPTPTDENSKEMRFFKIAVAEGLGIAIDKDKHEEALKVLEKRLEQPEIVQAIKLLQEAYYLKDRQLTDAEQDTIAKAVEIGGVQFQSLDALMNMAHLRQAQETGQVTYTTLTAGADGVANGPIISQVSMGTADPTIMAQGGFFPEGSPVQDANVWLADPTNVDLYQSIGRQMTRALGDMMKSKPWLRDRVANIAKITGDLTKMVNGIEEVQKGARTLMKEATTPLVFGQGPGTVARSMFHKFLRSYTEKLEAMAKDGYEPEQLQDLIDTMNDIMQSVGGERVYDFTIPNNMSLDEALAYEFTQEQYDALEKAFDMSLGTAIKQALKGHFASFIERRDALNRAAALSHKLYEVRKKLLTDRLLKQMMEEGRIATRKVDGVDTPLHGLTIAQQRELDAELMKMGPLIETAYSNGDPTTGIFVPKQERNLSPEVSAQIKPTFKDKSGKSKKGTFTTNATTLTTTTVEPGVRMIPLMAHSTDSATSHRPLKDNPILQVHDAHITVFDSVADAARNLNDAVFHALLEYSAPMAAFNMLARTLEALKDEAGLPSISDLGLNTKAGETIENIVEDTWNTALEATRDKLEAFLQVGYVSQYAFEGGSYEVTAEDKARIQELLDALPKEIPAEVLALAQDLDKRFGAPEKMAPKQQSPEPMAEPVPEPAVETEPAAEVELTPAVLSVIERISRSDNAELAAAAKKLRLILKRFKDLNKALQELTDGKQVSKSLAARISELVAKHAPTDHPLGILGISPNKSDAELVAYLERNGTVKARDLMGLLRTRLASQSSPIGKFRLELLNQLMRLVDPNLTIQYLTQEDGIPENFEPRLRKAAGWFTSSKTGEAIYIKGTDFAQAMITDESLLHELTHAALLNIRRAASADPKHPARPFVEELDRLLAKAQELVASDPALEQHAYAVQDVDEMIAFGMTDEVFQREVLMHPSLRIASKNRNNPVVSGMRRFIESLVGILWPGKTARELQYNGMRLLIDNVSALASLASKELPPFDDDVVTTAIMGPDPMTQLTNEQVLDALAVHQSKTLDPSFTRHLKSLLREITEKLHGPYGLDHAQHADDPIMSRVDQFAQTLATGQIPFVSKTLFTKLVSGPQEAFVLEQVEASIAAALDNVKTSSKTMAVNEQLWRIYREAKYLLTPAHFEKAYGVDAATAAEMHRFVFTAEQGADGRSTAMSRFAALGLTSPEFRTLLSFDTYRSTKAFRDMDWNERLMKVFHLVMDLLSGALSVNNPRDPARVQVSNLVQQLVQIENRRQRMLARRDTGTLAKLEDATKALSEQVRGKVLDTAQTDFVKKNRVALVRAAGNFTSLVAGDRVEAFMDHVQKLRDQAMQRRQGVAMGVINEAKTLKDWMADLLLAATRNEQQRKGIKDGTAQVLLNEFANELTDQEKADITTVLLRTDLPALLALFPEQTLDQLEALLADSARLEAEIRKLEAQVGQLKHGALYLRQAKDLGYHMVTGLTRNPNLHLNAYTMARLYGEQISVSESSAKVAEGLLDPLVSLYALRYTDRTAKARMADLMRREAGRPDSKNGVDFTLKLYAKLMQDSREKLFSDTPEQMLKGYLPELYNEGVEVLVADADRGKLLEAEGYVQVGPVVNDRTDPDQRPKFLYALHDRGLQAFNTGAMSYTGMRMRGANSRLHDGIYSAASGTQNRNNSLVHRMMFDDKQQLMRQRNLSASYDPAKAGTQNHMVPVFGQNGLPVNYRYMMSQSIKDTVLQRDNSFDKVLGALNGSIFDKVASADQNRSVIEALHEQYLLEGSDRPASFREISPDTSDPELREYWRLLPESSRRAVREIWGMNGMLVRTDHIDQIFGYRKYSLSNVWDKLSAKEIKALKAQGINPNAPERSIAENLFAGLMEALVWPDTTDPTKMAEIKRAKAAIRTRKIEDMIQELVRETKDILVVKTGFTLFYNIMSNVTQLYWMGVPLTDILTNGRIALVGAVQYREQSKELLRLKAMRDSGYAGNTQDIDQEIVHLEDALARNPARELIEAGLLPTIVEDIAVDEDPHSYKAKLANKLTQYTAGVPKPIKTVARTLYVAHDTPLYKLLSQGTQLSDFVARYALYQHTTTRRHNPLTREEAIRDASDSFVNYDVPSHRTLQYLNDMGLVMFTKYYIRIQRTIFRLWRENPARGLMLLTADHYFSGMQSLIDSTMGFGNPLEPSALKFIEAVDETLPVHVLTQTFD